MRLQTTNMTARLQLGKMPYFAGRRDNMMEVEIGFRFLRGNTESYFSVTWRIWNRLHTDCVSCGCCLDYIKENSQYIKPELLELFNRINALREYHLTSVSYIPKPVVRTILKTIRDTAAASGNKVVIKEGAI